MKRFFAVIPALVLAGALGVTAGDSKVNDGRQLYGYFGPGLTIHVLDGGPDGSPVTSLQPGNYWLTVDDNSSFHNFHIFGPGLNDVVTGVTEQTVVTVKIHLEHGTYTFQCDPHKNLGMIGTFDVGGVGQVG
jgi:hypothetical protein